MFEKMKLRSRILLGYLFPLLSLVIVAGLIFFNLDKAAGQNKLVESAYKIINVNTKLTLELAEMRQTLQHSIILKNTSSREHFQEVSTAFDKLISEFSEIVEDLEQQKKVDQFAEAKQKLAKLIQSEMDLIEAGKTSDVASEWSTKNLEITTEMQTMQENFLEQEHKILEERKENYLNSMSIVKNSIIYGISISIITAMVIGLWLAASMTRDISAMVSQISSTATEISATITEHERTASQQASATNQASSTIEELSATSMRSSEQASNAATAAEKASLATIQGSDTTHQAVIAMNNLKDKIATIAEQILRLGEQISQIGGIVVLVKDLSGQINMLALNAAVEAARAGENGKGFAVVASEVRKLADQSKKSAELATIVVSDIQKNTNSSIMMTEEGIRIVGEVTQLSQKVSEVFNNLSGMAEVVNENAHQVMLNVKQQSGAFVQMVEMTNSISAGAKETAAGISQTKIGILNLNEAAVKLKSIM